MDNYTPYLQVCQEEIRKNFASRRENQDYLYAVYRFAGLDGPASRVMWCGTQLEFGVNRASGERALLSANFCRDRFCQMCMWRRSLKFYSQLSQVLDYLGADHKYLFLTLTVRNVHQRTLRQQLDDMQRAWRYMYNKSPVWRRYVQGAVRSVEVTYNAKDGTYHPHYHVLLAVAPNYAECTGPYLSWQAWFGLWQSALEVDYLPSCRINVVRGASEGIRETVKYSVKPSDVYGSADLAFDASRLVGLRSVLSHVRMISFIGVFRAARKILQQDDVETGDLVNVSGEVRSDVYDLIVRFRWRHGVYVADSIQDNGD